MGQLKTSEVRLLIIFCLTVLGLGSFLLYEVYAKKLVEVDGQKGQLEAERTHLLTLKTQQTSYNEKLVWMNQNQPLARDEFQAKDVLDNIVSVRGIEAAGLVLVSAPPEKPHSKEAYYWAFERRVVVQGPLQNIVQWMTELQSETSFRAVTHLHIFPKKKKEPETLTCEVTVEQRYATDEVIAMTTPGVVMASSVAPVTQPESSPAPDNSGDPVSKPAEKPDADATEAPEEPAASRRVVIPGGTETKEAKPVRPKIRLPKPQTPKDASAATGSANSSMLANSRRPQRKTLAPPPMQADLDAARQFAYDNDRDIAPVKTAVVQAELNSSVPTQPILQTDGPLPTAPDQEIISVPSGAVGESWSAETPGAQNSHADSQPRPAGPKLPQTN